MMSSEMWLLFDIRTYNCQYSNMDAYKYPHSYRHWSEYFLTLSDIHGRVFFTDVDIPLAVPIILKWFYAPCQLWIQYNEFSLTSPKFWNMYMYASYFFSYYLQAFAKYYHWGQDFYFAASKTTIKVSIYILLNEELWCRQKLPGEEQYNIDKSMQSS